MKENNKYKKNIKNISEHQSEFKTDKMTVPSRLFMSEDLLPDEETFAKVEDIASNEVFSVIQHHFQISHQNQVAKMHLVQQLYLTNIFYHK